MAEPFLAQIVMFAGNFAPRGWAFCNGQLMFIAQNPALFSLLGTTYGGDGVVTFGLPELRGRFPVHSGNNSAGPGLSPKPLGSRSGAENSSLTVNQLPSHSHTVPNATLRASPNPADTSNPSGNAISMVPVYGSEAPTIPMHSDSVQVGQTENTGRGFQFSNLPPYLAVNFIIAIQGTFPSQN